jgi:hypothetical protein
LEQRKWTHEPTNAGCYFQRPKLIQFFKFKSIKRIANRVFFGKDEYCGRITFLAGPMAVFTTLTGVARGH